MAEETYGDIDVFCSNAGIIHPAQNKRLTISGSCAGIYLMAHVYAARVLAPKMAAVAVDIY